MGVLFLLGINPPTDDYFPLSLAPHYFTQTQNRHQAELITQLRQEAQQWKDQCLRLEESLRGEIKSWKDQFLRVDAERTRLLDQVQLSSSSAQVR